MQVVLFQPDNHAPASLKVFTVGIVLNPEQTKMLESEGGVQDLLSQLFPKRHARYKPFALKVKGNTSMIFRGHGEDNQGGYLRLRFEAVFGKEEFAISSHIPTHGEMIVPCIPRRKNRLFVYVNTSLPARRQQAGRLLTAYHPTKLGEEIREKAILPQAKFEWVSETTTVFRTWRGILPHIAASIGRIVGEKCSIEFRELPPYELLLARRTLTLTGNYLSR